MRVSLWLMALGWLAGTGVMAQGVAPTAPWPMYAHDPQHTSRSLLQGPGDAFERWRYLAPQDVSTWSVGGDGTIYLADGPGGLIALTPNGVVKWQVSASGPVTRFPLVTSVGNIVIADDNGQVTAFDPNGHALWHTQVGAAPSSPGIGADGTLYFASGDGMLHALSSGGAQVWATDLRARCPSSPVVGPTGLIYVGLADDTMRAIGPDGGQQWSFTATGLPYTPSVGADGTVYFGTDQGFFYAVDPAGQQRWSTQVNGSFLGVAIGATGILYAGATNGQLMAFDPSTGKQLWSFQALDTVFNPTVDAAGNVYFGTDVGDGYFYSLDPQGHLRWRFLSTAPNEAPPVIPADGGMLMSPGSRWLLAVSPTPAAPPSTPATLSLPTLDATPGSTVAVPLQIGSISAVTAVFADIGLAAASPATAPALTAGAPTPGAALGMGGTASFVGGQPQQHVAYVSVMAQAVHAINGPGPVLLLPVTVPMNAPPGAVYRLQFGQYEVDNPSGPIESVVAVGGAIRVAGGVVPGDLTGDGRVTAADALLAIRALVGLVQLTPGQAAAADFGHTGRLNLSDVMHILRLAVGLMG